MYLPPLLDELGLAEVTHDPLHPFVVRMARAIARGPILAHRATKRQLLQEWDMGVREAIIAEAHVQAELMQTRDFRRAYEAFTRRETPRFEGD